MREHLSKFKHLADLAIVITIAITLRILALTRYEIGTNEALNVVAVRQNSNDFLNLVSNNLVAPLYLLILKTFTTLAGTSIYIIRGISLVAGITLVLVVYKLLHKITSKEYAILGALLVSMSPYFVAWNTTATFASVFALTIVAAYYFLISQKYFAFMLACIAALTFHPYALAYVSVMLFLYIYTLHKNKFTKLRGYLRLAPILITVLSLYAVFGHTIALYNLSSLNSTPTLQKYLTMLTGYFFGVATLNTGDNTVLFPHALEIGITIAFLVTALMIYLLYKTKFLEEINTWVILSLALDVPLLAMLYFKISRTDYFSHNVLLPSAVFFIIGVVVMLYKLFKFEYGALLILPYLVGLRFLIAPTYTTGLIEITQKYANTSKEMVFEDSSEYIRARYYFGENNLNVHLPQDIKETLIRPNAYITPNRDSLFVTTNTTKEGYINISQMGNYYIYAKKR